MDNENRNQIPLYNYFDLNYLSYDDLKQIQNKFNLKIVNICKLFYNISNKNEENKQNQLNLILRY